MPLLALPSFAQNATASTVSISQGNGQTVLVTQYSASYSYASFVNPLGFVDQGGVNADNAVQATMTFSVDQSNFTRRVEFAVSVMDGADPKAQNVSVMFDLWDPSEVKDNVLILPDDSCKGKCDAPMRVAESETLCQTSCASVRVLRPRESRFLRCDSFGEQLIDFLHCLFEGSR